MVRLLLGPFLDLAITDVYCRFDIDYLVSSKVLDPELPPPIMPSLLGNYITHRLFYFRFWIALSMYGVRIPIS